VLVDVGPGEADGAGGAVLYLLLDEMRGELRVRRADVLLDLLLEVPGDEDDLAYAELPESIEGITHDRLPADSQQSLRCGGGVGAQESPLAGQRDNDFHVLPPLGKIG